MRHDYTWLRKVAKSQHIEEERLFAIAELTPNGRSILDMVFWPSEADNVTITEKMKEMKNEKTNSQNNKKSNCNSRPMSVR